MAVRDPKGNVRNHRRREATPLPAEPALPVHAAASAHPLIVTSDAELGILFTRFARIRGGYLKMRMDADGSVNHYTYTWSLGAHAGKYVYVRFNYWEVASALYELLRKVVEVEEGRLKPSPDKYLT